MFKIGIIGADTTNGNLGVQALGLAQVLILERLFSAKNTERSYIVFGSQGNEETAKRFSDLINLDVGVESVSISFRDVPKRKKMFRALSDCDLIVGITGGDSFSDIYGKKRFVSCVIPLLYCAKKNIPYFLAPQTYGPFKSWQTRILAKSVIREAYAAYSRDKQSSETVASLGLSEPRIVTDVAFFLPFQEQPKTHEGKIRVGINVSGLLWNDRCAGENEFGLSVDYKTFMKKVVASFGEGENICVELISHVHSSAPGSLEDDWAACKELASCTTSAVVIGPFENPIEAKSYISGFDLFMGSRMHATIAAFSSGVPTLPIAYSRKFEGLFGSLGYHETLDLCKFTMDQALEKVESFVANYEGLKEQQMTSLEAVNRLSNDYLSSLDSHIEELLGN